MLNGKSQLCFTRVIQPQKFKILLIVSPGKLTSLLKLELSHEGYTVEVTDDGISGLLKCQKTRPELVIVDWSIPDFSASDLCYYLRSSNHQVAILVLTNGKKNSDRVTALDAGADDCISQPFSMTEFLARIRAHLRRNFLNIQNLSILKFDNLNLNILTREVYRDDVYISLTTKEFALLEYLITHPRQVLTRNQILDHIWGYDYMGDSNIIEVYIRHLRRKMEQKNWKRLIYTVRSVGYVLRESSL
ncbi:MAG: response regulator transcription factor [Waterburya sp.]